MWELMRRIWAEDPEAEITGTALERCAASRTSRSSACTAATRRSLGSYTLDGTTHTVTKREMGVFEFKGGEVTPKAFFGIDGADYRTA